MTCTIRNHIGLGGSGQTFAVAALDWAGWISLSGRSVSGTFADIVQVHDGRWVSHRIYFDNMAMLAQLGALD